MLCGKSLDRSPRLLDVAIVDEHLEPGTPVVVGRAEVVVAKNVGAGADEGGGVHDVL